MGYAMDAAGSELTRFVLIDRLDGHAGRSIFVRITYYTIPSPITVLCDVEGPVAWCVEPAQYIDQRRHARWLYAKPSLCRRYHLRQLLDLVRPPLDTSFANNVINYSFAWFCDADNRLNLADGRAGQSVHSSADRKTANDTEYSWVSIAWRAAARSLLTQSNRRRPRSETCSSPQLNFMTAMTCKEIHDCLLQAIYVIRPRHVRHWPLVTYRLPTTRSSDQWHSRHYLRTLPAPAAANCNYCP